MELGLSDDFASSIIFLTNKDACQSIAFLTCMNFDFSRYSFDFKNIMFRTLSIDFDIRQLSCPKKSTSDNIVWVKTGLF